MLKRLILSICCLLFVSDCFPPKCHVGFEGEHGECIVYFEGQPSYSNDIDKALELYADNLQQILMNIEIIFTDTAIVRTCATPDLIRSNLDQLTIIFLEKPFNCRIDGKWSKCLGTEWKGEINLSWAEKISDTALAHELNHWVDELCGTSIEWDHLRTDWWSTEDLMNSVLKANGL
jgi:hypothetical protein